MQEIQQGEDKQVESLPSQLEAALDLANQKSLNVVKQFTESASAKAPGRKVFGELLNTIDERNDIKGIICWKLNRLFRNPVDEGRIRWLLESKKIDEIVTPTKTYNGYDSDFSNGDRGSTGSKIHQRFKRRHTKRN